MQRRALHAAAEPERWRDTGEFLSLLVRATGARRRLFETGASNGYSTLRFAQGAQATGTT